MTNLDLEKRVSMLEEKVQLLEQLLQNKKNISDSKNGQKKQSIREFLSTKNINNDRERTLVIAYFFEVVEGNETFNADDLRNCFSVAKLKTPANINDIINKNEVSIMNAKDKKDGVKAWTLTDTGEKEVENNLNKNNGQ